MNNDLIFVIFINVFVSIGIQRPQKSKYNNVFLVWIIYLILLVAVWCIFRLLVTNGVILFYLGKDRSRYGWDSAYWIFLNLINCGVIQIFMYFFTRLLKLQKPTEEDSELG